LVWDWYAWISSDYGYDPILATTLLYKFQEDSVLPSLRLDGLHAMAGSVDVIELHGNIHQVRCVSGDGLVEHWEEGPDGIGLCPICGGFLRPDVVWFGEELPRASLEAAFKAARRCEVFLSIGTSSTVQPAAALAYAARHRGARIIEINLEPTLLTPKTDYFLQGRSGEILPELFAAVWNIPVRG
jgi:NAD-dependent deacetylase